jgi:hypothetical protein
MKFLIAKSAWLKVIKIKYVRILKAIWGLAVQNRKNVPPRSTHVQNLVFIPWVKIGILSVLNLKDTTNVVTSPIIFMVKSIQMRMYSSQ